METKCGDRNNEDPEPAFSSKQELRAHRNRLAAAKSRDTRRQYIASLEYQVEELTRTVEELRKENWYWLSLDTTWSTELLHAQWCVESLQVVNESSL